jgi:hypothetical protein
MPTLLTVYCLLFTVYCLGGLYRLIRTLSLIFMEHSIHINRLIVKIKNIKK